MIFYNVNDIAGMLKVTTPTVYRWIDSGRLKRVGGRGLVRVERQDLREFLGMPREDQTPARPDPIPRSCEPTPDEIERVIRDHTPRRGRHERRQK